MYNICYHLLETDNIKDHTFKEYSDCSGPIYETINRFIQTMDDILGDYYTDLEIFPECYGQQREIFMKFIYKGLECEIFEDYDTQMDYLCVRITKQK